MKCLKSYKMHTAGGHYEVAASQEGVYFVREFGFNGFGLGWSKWLKCGKICGIEKRRNSVCVMFENCINGSRSFIIDFKYKKNNPNYRLPN